MKLNERALPRGNEQGRFSDLIGALFHQGFVATCEGILRRANVGGPKNHQQTKRVLYGGQ